MAKGYKTGGREKGTPNVITTELRSVLKSLLHREFENIPAYLEELDTKDRLDFLIKLLPYALPKIESVHMTEGEPDEFWESDFF